MTTVQECLQEVIAHGPGYVIHSSGEEGPARTADWDPSALLADIQLESPRLLEDHAWTEWTTLADGSQTCAIVYGRPGSPPGDRAILGYGSLRAFEAWHKRPGERVHAPAPNGFYLGR